MLSSGFTNAPISRLLVFYVVLSAILVTATDTKHYLYIQVIPHIWRYRQFWRMLTWPICYTNSTEVLFAAMTLYNLRIIERLWGSRKFASFLVAVLLYTTLFPPLILTFILRPLSFNNLNYLPSGPTAIIFALLAQYHASIPYVYRYRISSSPAAPETSTAEPRGILLTSKSMSYLLPIQLALAQFPGSLIPAMVGWIIGYAWRAEMLVIPSAKWRVPEWLYGGKSKSGRSSAAGERLEGLRRRMEDEVSAEGRASGRGAEGEGERTRRRPLGTAILDRFRGAF